MLPVFRSSGVAKYRKDKCNQPTSYYFITDVRPCEAVQGFDVNNENTYIQDLRLWPTPNIELQ